MTEISTTTTGVEHLAQHLAKLPQAAAAAQHTVVKALGDRYVLALKEATPQGHGEQPGRLRSAYETEEAYSAEGAHYRIVNKAPHLRYVLEGRGEVHAVNAKALRFVIDGVVFFRRSVGPAAPNDFPSRVAAQMQGEVAAAKAQLPGLIVRMYGGGG
jgi:hypothetical protein